MAMTPTQTDTTDTASAQAQQAKQHIKQEAQELRAKAEQAQAKAKQAGKEVIGSVKEKAESLVEEQKDAAVEQIDGVAGALRKSAKQMHEEQAWLAQGVEQAADTIDSMAKALRNKDIGTLMGDLEDYTRRQPMMVLGGAAVVGFLLARFIKSSGHRPPADHSGLGQANRSYQSGTDLAGRQ